MSVVVLRRDDPDPAVPEGEPMEFRLTYEGQLKGPTSGNSRVKHKHEIRKHLHKQLLRLRRTHPYLKDAPRADARMGELSPRQSLFNYHAGQYARLGYNFVPLVTAELSLICRVNILFLRPEMPGGLLTSGDLDNRLKTIFDALRMPSSKDELGGYDTPEDGEKPFCVLVEDDKLISHIAIETDTLLEPVSEGFDQHDARLVVAVHLHPINMGWHNINFG